MADYNINAVTRRVVFSGSAGVGPYAFTFEILAQTDIAVYKNSTKLTLTTDYTVTINANGTGSVTLVVAATGSDTITIIGSRAIERTTDFVTAGDLLASSLNEQLDSQIVMIQQLAEENKRTIKAPAYDPADVADGGTASLTLPSAADRANQVLAFDASGNPIATEEIGEWKGDWATATTYAKRDIVKDASNSNVYRANTAHTSSGSTPISSNADVAKWDLIVDAAAAASSAAAASTSETNAANSASSAASSASAASSSASAAASSASSASSAQSAAESARDATLAAYDNFDDRYLGPKSSAPTLDNDGNALIAGALYFDTTSEIMKVYTGSAWVTAYGPAMTAAEIKTNYESNADTNAFTDAAATRVDRMPVTISEQGADGAGDDKAYVQAAIDAGVGDKPIIMDIPCTVGAGAAGGVGHGIGNGAITTNDEMHLIWYPGAVTNCAGFSFNGSILENARYTASDTATIQDKLTIDNPQMDGSNYPDPVSFSIDGASTPTTTTVKLTGSTSAITDYYKGLAIEHSEGSGGLAIVTAFDATTKIVTLSPPWVAPTTSATVFIGFNDNAIGIGIGASNVTINGGVLTNFPHTKMVPVVGGGKGVNMEQGLHIGRINGTHVENCSQGFFMQAASGTLGSGANKQTRPLIYSNITAKNCGSALTIDGNLNDGGENAYDQTGIVNNLAYEDCGYFPWRFVVTDQQKSGCINIGQGQNIIINGFNGVNSASYDAPTWPVDYPARCGYGLTGYGVGAIIWGWGRNISINNGTHYGNVDYMLHICRTRAMGNDTPPTSGNDCLGWNVRNVTLRGNCLAMFAVGATGFYKVGTSDLTGYIELAIDGTATNLVHSGASGYSSVVLKLTNLADNTVVIGTPAQIYSYGNTFASYTAGSTTDLQLAHIEADTITTGSIVNTGSLVNTGRIYSQVITGLNDDIVTTVTPPVSYGMCLLSSSTSLLRLLFTYRTGVSPQGTLIAGNTTYNDLSTGTGAFLTDGTSDGVDLKFNVGISSDGKIYFKNRRGISGISFTLTFFG